MHDKDIAIQRMAALSIPTRVELFERLLRCGCEGMGSTKLAGLTGEAQSTVSAQLQVLTRAGLVRRTAQGKEKIYTADREAVRELMAFLEQRVRAAA